MNLNKKVDTNLGITVILVISAILVIIDFYYIGSQLDGYPFNDVAGGSVVTDGNISAYDGMLVYSDSDSKGIVDDVYSFGDTSYHLIFSKNNKFLMVEGKEIFKTDLEVQSIYLYNDVISIVLKNGEKYDLIFIDLNGKEVKKLVDLGSVSISGNTIYYSYVDNYVQKENEIYESHSVPVYMINYLGNYNFSTEVKDHDNAIYTVDCVSASDYCLIYNKNSIKIEYIHDDYEHKKVESNYSLVINGNKVEIGPQLLNVILLPDNYLLVQSCFQDGHTVITNIVDLKGNIITDFSNLVKDDEFTAHSLIDFKPVYLDGVFNIYTVSLYNYDKFGYYFEDICSTADMNVLLGRHYTFKYLGNGKVENAKLVRTITSGDYLAEYRETLCKK